MPERDVRMNVPGWIRAYGSISSMGSTVKEICAAADTSYAWTYWMVKMFVRHGLCRIEYQPRHRILVYAKDRQLVEYCQYIVEAHNTATGRS